MGNLGVLLFCAFFGSLMIVMETAAETDGTCAAETCYTYSFTCSKNKQCTCFKTSDGDGFCANLVNVYCNQLTGCPDGTCSDPNSVCIVGSCCMSNVCVKKSYGDGCADATTAATSTVAATSTAAATTTTAAVPTTKKPDRTCNGHGTCQCDQAYTGSDCGQEVDWCQQQTIEIDGHPPVKSICGDRGTCISTVNGAQCVCDPGFTGQFCDHLIPGELFLSKRCLAYNGTFNQNGYYTPYDQIGCSNYQECVPDDIQCLLTPCNEPEGWCLPNERAKGNNTYYYDDNLLVIGYRYFPSEDVVSGDGSASCDGHGTCACDYGYTGKECESEINWCDQPAAGFEETAPIKDICGDNGTCISQPSGATCVCEYGFTGEFCHEVIPSEVFVSHRCYDGAPSGGLTTEAYPVGCGDDFACIPDNLNCLINPKCGNTIGWCLPLAHFDNSRDKLKTLFLEMMKNQETTE